MSIYARLGKKKNKISCCHLSSTVSLQISTVIETRRRRSEGRIRGKECMKWETIKNEKKNEGKAKERKKEQEKKNRN